MGWGRGAREEPAVQAAYVKWLAERRASDPAFCPYAPATADKLGFYGAGGNAMALFMADVERRSAARMIAYLRTLGSKALFTNANNGPHPVAMQNVRADLYDYVDDHFYVDHPHFLERRWRLPSKIGNLNPVLDKKLALVGSAFVRLADKPFCITEWNFSGPGMYRGVGGIMTGAFSALQDWDGLWRFAYAHGAKDLAEGPCKPGYFNVGTDPLGQAADRASVCLFLRRDLAPLAEGTALRVTDAAVAGTTNAHRVVVVRPAWGDAAWHRRVATAGAATRVPPGMAELPITEALYGAERAPFAYTPVPGCDGVGEQRGRGEDGPPPREADSRDALDGRAGGRQRLRGRGEDRAPQVGQGAADRTAGEGPGAPRARGARLAGRLGARHVGRAPCARPRPRGRRPSRLHGGDYAALGRPALRSRGPGALTI